MEDPDGMRYFRATAETYAAIGRQLDAAYGYPNRETNTERTLPPTAELPADAAGRVYLAIESGYCDYILPAQILTELMASGAVEEVSANTYAALLPTGPA